jgi:tetratricopeptide (TPR) repeat protein
LSNAEALAELGEVSRGTALVLAYHQAHPSDADTRAVLAALYEHGGRYEAAAGVYEALIESQLGRDWHALSDNEVMRVAPSQRSALAHLRRLFPIYQRLRRDADALRAGKLLAALDPESAQLANELVRVASGSGHALDAALGIYKLRGKALYQRMLREGMSRDEAKRAVENRVLLWHMASLEDASLFLQQTLLLPISRAAFKEAQKAMFKRCGIDSEPNPSSSFVSSDFARALVSQCSLHQQVNKQLFALGLRTTACFPNAHGWTALHLAVRWGSTRVLNELRERGADDCAFNRTATGATLLHIAMARGSPAAFFDVLDLYAEAARRGVAVPVAALPAGSGEGADGGDAHAAAAIAFRNARDDYGRTPLDVACLIGLEYPMLEGAGNGTLRLAAMSEWQCVTNRDFAAHLEAAPRAPPPAEVTTSTRDAQYSEAVPSDEAELALRLEQLRVHRARRRAASGHATALPRGGWLGRDAPADGAERGAEVVSAAEGEASDEAPSPGASEKELWVPLGADAQFVESVRASDMSPERFVRDFVSVERPVVVRGALSATVDSEWARVFRALSFKSLQGDRTWSELEVVNASAAAPTAVSRFSAVRTSLGEFLRYMRRGAPRTAEPSAAFAVAPLPPPSLQANASLPRTPLTQLWRLPACVAAESVAAGMAGSAIELHVGPRRSGATMHVAPLGRLSLLFYGTRRWSAMPPAFAQHSAKHVTRWLRHDYEGLVGHVRPLDALQEAGDLVYMPPAW